MVMQIKRCFDVSTADPSPAELSRNTHPTPNVINSDQICTSYSEQQVAKRLLSMTRLTTTKPQLAATCRPALQTAFVFTSTALCVVLLLTASTFGQAVQTRPQRQPMIQSATQIKIQSSKPEQAASKAASTTAAAKPASSAASKTEKAGKAETPDADTQLILNTIKALPSSEKRAMFAYYKDLGVDLSPWLEPSGDPIVASDGRRRQLSKLIRSLKFVRRPEAVLQARSQIGLNPESLPGNDASDKDIVNWFHRHAMAAEWAAVKAVLVMRAGKEAESMYAALIQGTNNAQSELIPEDVLGLSEAAPAKLTDWQVDSLAGLLKASARKTSTRPLIERFRKGTTWFGTKDDEQRDRTVRLLLAANLPIEAFEFMPSLEDARKEKDVVVMKGHAEYLMARAAEAKDISADRLVESAWSLLGEIALLDDAEVSMRSECLNLAVDLLPRVPPGPGVTWLRSVFEHPSLAPAGLQAVALKALKLQDDKLPEAVRAQAILTMKEAVDTLLAQQNVRMDQLTVPLRMLTIGLLTRAEDAIRKQGTKNQVSKVAALLLRSMPNEAWRNQIEPSLVGRAYKGFIGVALIADETDLALELLEQGIERQPAMSSELAGNFLNLWVRRMKAKTNSSGASGNSWFYSFSRGSRPSAPITRGWQQRNLDRLAELLNVLDDIGVDGRSLPGVVNALSACYGPTQAYDRDTVERILGPVEKIRSPVAAQLASTMRTGLSGDWRSRKAQEDAGFERSDSELRKIVEDGYEFATALAEAAVANCEDEQRAWEHAILRAALSFDRMQFRGEREQDAVAYNQARKLVFSAFADAASRYRKALAEGRVRPNLQIYNAWFSLALGASDLGALTLEDLMTEGLENADQIDRMREDILKMSPDQSAYHFDEFARSIMSNLSETKPEVKPRLVQAAARLVGDDPAGAPILRTLKLYNELVQDEIHLHLAVDGSDRVGTEPFGATLTLQHTASINRSSGGFSRYLMSSFSQFNAGQWQTINYQERLQKSIETSFGNSVQLLGIGFFQPMNPAVPFRLKGKTGWQEKPLAYLVLQATDPSVDSLPPVQMDMHFNDASGPIVLPVMSNTLLIDASADPAPRPVADLVIEQKLDARSILENKDEQTVTLEITANAAGVVPEISRLMQDLGNPLPGYQLDQAQLVTDPYDVSQLHRAQPEKGKDKQQSNVSPYARRGESLPNLDPDSDGVFRLGTMRKWTVTYVPEDSVTAAKPDEFAFPTLNELATAKLVSVSKDPSNKTSEETREAAQVTPSIIKKFTYDDFDLVAVEGPAVSFQPTGTPMYVWALCSLAVVFVAAWLAYKMKSASPLANKVSSKNIIPEVLTPTGAALLLRRINQSEATAWPTNEQAELQADIDAIQKQHFAAATAGSTDASQATTGLRATVQRWIDRLEK